jgi:hypothetical protein
MSETIDGMISDELDGVQFGDKRLDERSQKLITSLAVDPQLSVNASCHGWNETHAAYSFLDNAKVLPEKILCPHRTATQRRMLAHSVVLMPQDTTELDYTAHPQQDAKCLNRKVRFGLYVHVQLAVTPARLNLGVVWTHSFDRSPESLGLSQSRSTLAIEDKDSYCWLRGFRIACELQGECPETQVVSIADREGDIYELYVDHRDHIGPRADFLIRVKLPRSTMDRDKAVGPNAYCKVLDELRSSPLLGTRTIDLPATPKRKARQARLEIRARTLTVKPPHAQGHLTPVIMNAVLVEEIGGRGDGTDVSWQLITSLPIDAVEQVLLVLDYDRCRWAIEEYFKTLKTGCRVESLQLNNRLGADPSRILADSNLKNGWARCPPYRIQAARC